LNHRTTFTLIVLALMLTALAGCSTVTPAPGADQPAPAEATGQATSAPPETPSQGTPAAPAGSGNPVPTPPADGGRPLAQVPPAERADRFSGPAPMSVDPNQIYEATIVTSKGNIVAELYTDTPESVNNFVTLAQNGFYDGLTFHRVEPGFVIQGGDPKGDGGGSPGYTIPAEINHNHSKGALAWARTSDEVNPERRSSGSQFYITLDETPHLDGAYSVFGQVIEGMDVAEKIAVGDKIERIDISTPQVSRMPTPAPTRTPAPTPTPGPTEEPKAPTAEEGRPLAKLSADQREKLYNTAPATTIDPTKSYQATIKTPKGDVVIDLDAKAAPGTVGNFVLLANLGFYDGLPIAYLQADSYAVFGSPKSQPDSDIGYALDLEPSAGASSVITGTVSMYPVPDLGSGDVKASGSQFFVSFVQAPNSDTPLNSFGTVTSGIDILKELKAGDIVESVKISEK
jgi:cyclophilin family peptidyl-prolyl cis-trans isomerase